MANLSDFDADQDVLDPSDWLEIDRYAVQVTERLQKQVTADYTKFEFHHATQKLQTFCSEDLGGFYLDILKDRLYTSSPKSKERKAAQNAMWHITHSLLRLMAPVLSFTADEAWSVFSGDDNDSLLLHTWYEFPETEIDLLKKWDYLRQLRGQTQKELEQKRAEGEIGSSLEAEVEITANGNDYQLLRSIGDDWNYVLLTSKTIIREGESEAFNITVSKSPHNKCERCWHYRADVGIRAEHPTICGRCVSSLEGVSEMRKYA